MKTGFKIACFGVLAMCLAHAQAGGGVTLQYKPKAGELIYRTTTKMNQTQNVLNKELKNEMNNSSVGIWNVGEPDKDGNIEIRSETKVFEAKMKIEPIGEYTFDSRKNDNERGSALGGALTPLYERMSNANISFTINPLGKVVKLEGYKELLGDLLKDNPIAAQFAGGGSDEVFKMSMNEFIIQFSGKPINPGDRWEMPYEINLDKLGKAIGKKTYIYEGEENVGPHKTAKISIGSEMNFDLDLDMGGAKVTGKMSITEAKGTMNFDVKRGCILRFNNEYKMAGNLNVNAGGKDIPIATEQTQQLTIELLDKLPK